jgi:hypothetical protein
MMADEAGTWRAPHRFHHPWRVYAALWVIFDRESLDFHGFAALVTWLMTLFIQRAEHRDTRALQAKRDEVLHALDRADDGLTRIDEKEP